MAETAPSLTHDDYTVGWICALPDTELVVARAMLDEEHPMLLADPGDTNAYSLGRIGSHNVVIACLPAEKTGTVSAAIVAKDMLRSFKAVRFGLMVGVGGGVPCLNLVDKEASKTAEGEDDTGDEDTDEDDALDSKDVRLGDVVISLQSKSSDAVVQYDFGKSLQGGEFIRTGTLNKPPNILLSALSALRGQHELDGRHKLSDHLSKMVNNRPHLAPKFQYPGSHKDRAFRANVPHLENKKTCKACCGAQDINLIKRKNRDNTSPALHYGTVGSADQVMKDSILRDKWAKREGIICFEMEAAGTVSLSVLCSLLLSSPKRAFQLIQGRLDGLISMSGYPRDLRLCRFP
jgi:nucleoside phosphorylase